MCVCVPLKSAPSRKKILFIWHKRLSIVNFLSHLTLCTHTQTYRKNPIWNAHCTMYMHISNFTLCLYTFDFELESFNQHFYCPSPANAIQSAFHICAVLNHSFDSNFPNRKFSHLYSLRVLWFTHSGCVCVCLCAQVAANETQGPKHGLVCTFFTFFYWLFFSLKQSKAKRRIENEYKKK